MRHHKVGAVLFVPSPRCHLLDERQRFPVFAHSRQPNLTVTPQRWQQGFHTQVFIQFVPRCSVGYYHHTMESLPLPDEIVSQQEPLRSVNLNNPMGDRVPHLERPVLPCLHYAAVLAAAGIKP